MLFDPKWKPAEIEIKLEPWQKLLLRAADIIEEKGWCQHHMHRSGRSCMVGAIKRASKAESPLSSAATAQLQAHKRLEAYLMKLGYNCISGFNDHKTTTRKLALVALREAAKG